MGGGGASGALAIAIRALWRIWMLLGRRASTAAAGGLLLHYGMPSDQKLAGNIAHIQLGIKKLRDYRVICRLGLNLTQASERLE